MENQFCPKCGAAQERAGAFCAQCGQSLAAPPPLPAQDGTVQPPVAPTPPLPPQAPSMPVPPQAPPTTPYPPHMSPPVSPTNVEPPPAAPQYTTVVEVNYPKAGIGSRLLAAIVDGLIGGLSLLPGAIIMSINNLEFIGGFLMLLGGCWSIFYGYCKDGFANGQSYGKRMNGLMVVKLSNNEPCGKGLSILRVLPFMIPYIGGLVEIIMTLVMDRGRRLGDRLAGTQVIEVKHYKR